MSASHLLAPRFPLSRLDGVAGRVLAAALVLVVAGVDYLTGYEMRLSIFYLLPIAIAAWSAGLATGIACALAACLFWLMSFYSSAAYSHRGYLLWESTEMLIGFVAFAWALSRLRLALLQAEERFTLLVDGLRAAVFVADEEADRILYANGAWQELFGAPAGLRPSGLRARLSAVATAATAEAGFALQSVRDRDSERWFLLQSGAIPWGRRHVTLSVLTDVTVQKNAERLHEKHLDVMHRSARLATMAEIASTLAHEINQPLMTIATYTDACQRLLESGSSDMGEIARALQKCHAQAVRASAIIQRLREFIRERQQQASDCDARQLAEEALAISHRQLEEAGCQIDATGLTPGIVFRGDRLLLLQVLCNLLRNAADAMAEHPGARRLRLAVAREGEEVVFVVADSGPGIDAAYIAQIFSPFFTTKSEGLGLGLAISRSVALAHGGRLDFASAAGGGTEFRLRLPVEALA